MTTNVQSDQPQAAATEAKDIGDPNISFTEYEALRRGGEKTEQADKSATESEKTSDQNAAKSEDAETESKEDADSELDESDAEEADKSDEAEKDKPKKKSGYQRRVDKLNARIAEREARLAEREREIEYLRQQARGAGGEKSQSKVEATHTPDASGEPDPSTFETHAEYIKAVAKWTVSQEQRELSQKAERERFEAEQKKVIRSHQERVESYKAKTPDFEEMLENLDGVPNSPTVESLILTSENGPEILHELARNPEEAKRICSLPPLAAAREIGRIESKLARATDGPKVEPKKLTNAPKPIAPVGGSGNGPVTRSIYDANIPFAEYERLRREQTKRKNA